MKKGLNINGSLEEAFFCESYSFFFKAKVTTCIFGPFSGTPIHPISSAIPLRPKRGFMLRKLFFIKCRASQYQY